MTVWPKRDREKYKEEERKKQEELKRKQEAEAKRVAEEQRKQLRASQQYVQQPHDVYRENRRKLVKIVGLGILTAVAAEAFRLIYSFSNLSNQYSQQQFQQSTEQESSKSEQSTEEIATSTTEDPNTWPMRKTLQELKDAQQEVGSHSQFYLPEYNFWDDIPNNVKPEEWIEVTHEEYARLYGDPSNIKSARLTLYFDQSRGYQGWYYIDFVTNTPEQPKVLGHGGNDMSDILSMWEPDDKTDKVLFKSRNYKSKIISG
jgi:hypothetical protein